MQDFWFPFTVELKSLETELIIFQEIISPPNNREETM